MSEYDWYPSPQPAADPQAAPDRPTRTGWVVAVAAALIVGAGAGYAIGHSTASGSNTAKGKSASPSTTAPSEITVNGTLELTDSSGWTDLNGDGPIADSDPCTGGNGYDDIATGTQVIISTDAGRTLTIVALGDSFVTTDSATNDKVCNFEFTAQVPAGYAFYGVEVGHRGVVKESAADLPDVALTLGN